jgi:inner membrane protein
MSDLRMGQEPDYVFRHAIATRGNPHWHPIESRRLPATMNMDRVRGVWDRIWNEP